jgi:hypothetical protein
MGSTWKAGGGTGMTLAKLAWFLKIGGVAGASPNVAGWPYLYPVSVSLRVPFSAVFDGLSDGL